MPLNQQSIITILGLEGLPPERKAKLIEEASDLVEKRLTIRVVEALSPEQRKQFDELVESGTDAQVAEYVQKTFPNLPQWIDEEINKVKSELSEMAPSID